MFKGLSALEFLKLERANEWVGWLLAIISFTGTLG